MGAVIPLPCAPRQTWRAMALKLMSDSELDAAIGGRDAADWVDAAAGSGMAHAQLRLGRLLLTRPGDPRAAYACFLCAAETGSSEGFYLMGRCHEQGWGVPRDSAQARGCYRRAAEAGDFRGAFHYAGLLAADGCVTGALHWFERALLLAPGGAEHAMRESLAEHPLDAVRALARLLKETGLTLREALLEAGPVRLRPILLTTVTNVAAMLPMLILGGSGTETLASMAAVITFGLSFSTLITLVLVPVMYENMDWLINKFKRKRKDSDSGAAASLSGNPAESI